MHQPCSDEATNSRTPTAAIRQSHNAKSSKGTRIKVARREFVTVKPPETRSTHGTHTARPGILSSVPAPKQIRIALKGILSTVRPVPPSSSLHVPVSRNIVGKGTKIRIHPSRLVLSHSEDPDSTSADQGSASDYSADASNIADNLSDTSNGDSTTDSSQESEEEKRIFEVDKARIVAWICGANFSGVDDEIEQDDMETEAGFQRQRKRMVAGLSKWRRAIDLDSTMDAMGSTEYPEDDPREERPSNANDALVNSLGVCEPEEMASQATNAIDWSDATASIPDQMEGLEDLTHDALMRSDDTLVETEESSHHQPDYESDVDMLDDDFEPHLYDYLVDGTPVETWDGVKRSLKAVNVFDSMKELSRPDNKVIRAPRRFHPYARAAKSSKSSSANHFADHFAAYELRWKYIYENPSHMLTFAGVPWPIFPIAKSPEDVTETRIDDFIQFSKTPGDIGLWSRAVERLKMLAHRELVKRWRFEKFTTDILPRIVDPTEKQAALLAAGTVWMYLTRIEGHGADLM